MIKCIILFYFISFCYSIPRFMRSYIQIVLVQHFPITSFFVQQVSYKKVNTSSAEFAEYIHNNSAVFDSQRWVIHGFWPIDLEANVMENCVDFHGRRPVYNTSDLNWNFKRKLKKKWPILELNGTAESLWETAFNKYGSCVAPNATFYFTEATRLLDRYNIAGLLRSSGIVPGHAYKFSKVLRAIKSALNNKQVFLSCIPAPETRAEYLLEVRLCFNIFHILSGCQHRPRNAFHHCNTQGLVLYPKTPTFIY